MKCKYGQNGACEKLFRPNCPDSSECYEFELYTNADRIRAMSDEELATFIVDKSPGMFSCNGRCLYWLRQPAEEDTQ